MSGYLQNLIGNQIVTGGAALVLFGGVLAAMRSIPLRLWSCASNRLLFTIEIHNTDQAYPWVRAWVAARSKARFLSAGVDPSLDPPRSGSRSEKPRFYLLPRGVSIIRYRGRRVFVWTTKQSIQASREWRETITLQSLRGGKVFFEQLLSDAYDEAMKINAGTVEVWIPDGSNWQMTERKTARPTESLCLPPGVREKVIDDAKHFTSRRQWYLSTGVPFRRGYLLHGPPGNGKSSLTHALASELKTNINIVNLASFYGDAELMSCLARIPKGHVLLLEDVDAVFVGREAQGATKITFSALLNAIDGVCAQEGRILVMTTNHREVLDPALIRAGRADVHVFIGNATAEQAAGLCRRFFPAADRVQVAAFVEQVPDEGMSMAAIQECLLRAKDVRHAIHLAEELGAGRAEEAEVEVAA